MFLPKTTYEELKDEVSELKNQLASREESIAEYRRSLEQANTQLASLRERIEDMNDEYKADRKQHRDRLETVRKEYEEDLQRIKEIKEEEMKVKAEALYAVRNTDAEAKLKEAELRIELLTDEKAYYKRMCNSGKIGIDYSDIKGMLLSANPSGGAAFQKLMESNKSNDLP